MKKLLPILFFACCSFATAQDTIRVCTYNVLNYSMTNEDGRSERFERILREIKPDILIAQEIVDAEAAQKLGEALFNALGGVDIGSNNFHDGPDTDNMVYYNLEKFQQYSNVKYRATALRDIMHISLLHRNTEDGVHIFSLHLKAGDTQEDENHRTSEIQVLLENLGVAVSGNAVVAGDFNFYSPDEVPYAMLAKGGGDILFDPLGHTWERNSTQYLNFYTQSPRISASAACGGGTGGGMDDRFDFIFHSEALRDNYVPGSYTVYGNDGIDRRNSPINDPPNIKVSATIADDLACASDHLPVYADFVMLKPTSVEEYLLQEITFNETHDNITITLPASGTVTVVDILGRILLKENVGSTWNFKKDGLQDGVYFIQLQSGRISEQYKFIVTE